MCRLAMFVYAFLFFTVLFIAARGGHSLGRGFVASGEVRLRRTVGYGRRVA